jgi:predicted Zn-dependent protease
MTVADRWFYFPMVGLLGIIGTLSTKLLSAHPNWRIQIIFLSIIVIFLFSVRTIIRNYNWHDATTLFKHDLLVSKNNYELELLLSYELNKIGNYKESLIHSKNSIQYFPTYSGWSNLGVAEIKSGDTDQGITALKNAYALLPYEDVAQNLSYALLKYKSPQDAKNFINQQLVKFPNNPYFWFYLAIANYKLGNNSDTITAAQQCYSLSAGEKFKVIYLNLQKNQNIPPEILRKLLN